MSRTHSAQGVLQMSHRRGFTLIELLVVIAIIAILAAILFPVFARAREKARQTSCLSNVKELSLAVRMYTDDYDETLPPSEFYVDTPDGRQIWTWHTLVYPYVKNAEIYVCPSRRASGGRPLQTLGGYDAKHSRAYANYAYNCRYLQRVHGWKIYQHNKRERGGLPLSWVTEPAQTIMLGEAADISDQYWNGVQIRATGGWEPAPIHNGGANLGFVDGHAKWMQEQNYSGLDNRSKLWVAKR